MDNEPLRLAYEIALRSIDDLTRVIDGLRARAGTLFAAAALVTSFFGGQAVTRAQPPFHTFSLTAGAVLAFAATSLLTLVILWPFDFKISLSATGMIALIESRADDAP